jgi:hypothetical protein
MEMMQNGDHAILRHTIWRHAIWRHTIWRQAIFRKGREDLPGNTEFEKDMRFWFPFLM